MVWCLCLDVSWHRMRLTDSHNRKREHLPLSHRAVCVCVCVTYKSTTDAACLLEVISRRSLVPLPCVVLPPSLVSSLS